ncbi:MAG: PilZ domain-containing protein [Acidobacteriaceae bacterium]
MNSPGPERRRPRSKMVIGVKVASAGTFGKGGELVHTLDVSVGGARLGGLRDRLNPGDLLTLQRNHQKANCKVVWAREVSDKEIQIGIELLDTDGKIWGLDLSQHESDRKKADSDFMALLSKK